MHCFSSVSRSFKELGGLNSTYVVTRRILNLTPNGFKKTSCFALKADGGFTTVPRSKENDVQSKESTVSEQDNATTNSMLQADPVAFGTVVADKAPVQQDFFIDNDELDLDCPTEGFSSISDAIEDIRQGKVWLVWSD